MYIGDYEITKVYLGDTEVQKMYLGDVLVWEPSGPTPIDYSKIPLTFKITGDGDISWLGYGTTSTIEYSLNNGSWTSITSTNSGYKIPVVKGDTVKFKGNNNYYAVQTSNTYRSTFSGTTATFEVFGNIMSMIYGDNYINNSEFGNYKYQFFSFFRNCTGLTSAENLVLPASTMKEMCYSGLFFGCSSLLKAPELPATTLYDYCYDQMFYGCTSLEKGPDLLVEDSLPTGAYRYLFYNCTSLNYIKCMTATVPKGQTMFWVINVPAGGTFIKNANANWGVSGGNGVPSGWTIEDAT